MLAQFYPPMIGGEERHVRNLSVELASRGHEVHVACLDVGQPPVVDPGVTVHALPNVGVKVPALYPTADRPLALPIPDPYVSRALSRLVASVRPDVVHAHNWIINSYLPLSAARRLPLVYSLHDYSHVCPTKRLMFEDAPCSGPGLRKCFACTTDWYGAGRGPVIQSMVRSGRPIRNRVVDVFTPVSTFVGKANELPNRASGGRWSRTSCRTRCCRGRPSRATRSCRPATTSSSPETSRTRRGSTRCSRRTHSWTRTPGPSCSWSDARRWTSRRCLPAPGPGRSWDHERVVSGFAHARAAVLPSKWPDPCPTTVLEAMALGAPLVTTHMGGIADMVTHEESALVVPPGDVAATAAALTQISTDPALGGRLATQARIEVQRYLQSRVAADFEEIYASLV